MTLSIRAGKTHPGLALVQKFMFALGVLCALVGLIILLSDDPTVTWTHRIFALFGPWVPWLMIRTLGKKLSSLSLRVDPDGTIVLHHGLGKDARLEPSRVAQASIEGFKVKNAGGRVLEIPYLYFRDTEGKVLAKTPIQAFDGKELELFLQGLTKKFPHVRRTA